MKFIYKINPNIGGSEVTIEADSYQFADGYFNFYEGFSPASRSKVASIAAAAVTEVRRESNDK